MVLRTYYECDRCGKHCEDSRIYVTMDRRADNAGSMENVEEIDLCSSCCRWALGNFLYLLNRGQCREWLLHVRTKIKPNQK